MTFMVFLGLSFCFRVFGFVFFLYMRMARFGRNFRLIRVKGFLNEAKSDGDEEGSLREEVWVSG